MIRTTATTMNYNLGLEALLPASQPMGSKSPGGLSYQDILRSLQQAQAAKNASPSSTGTIAATAAANVSTADMTMDEYRSYISEKINRIPFHVTRPYDEEAIIISDEGWEAMRKNPDYEAWVLDYIARNRSVKNPFFGAGDCGMYSVEHFGATPAEHHGHGFSKIFGGTVAGARAMFAAESTGCCWTNRDDSNASLLKVAHLNEAKLNNQADEFWHNRYKRLKNGIAANHQLYLARQQMAKTNNHFALLRQAHAQECSRINTGHKAVTTAANFMQSLK